MVLGPTEFLNSLHLGYAILELFRPQPSRSIPQFTSGHVVYDGPGPEVRKSISVSRCSLTVSDRVRTTMIPKTEGTMSLASSSCLIVICDWTLRTQRGKLGKPVANSVN